MSILETGEAIRPVAAAEEPDSTEARVRIVMAGGLILIAAGCLVVKLWDPFEFLPEDLGWFVGAVVHRVERLVAGWSLVAMWIYPAALLGILMLERLYPAVPDQKTLSTGLVHDALWVLIEATFIVLFVGWYGRLLYGIYEQHLSFLTLPVAEALPAWLRLVIGAVVLDFTRWVQHWLHHNVRWLWPFHAVHHAQRELNVFSDHRIHFMEYLVRRPVCVLPMLMLGLEAPEITWWLLLLSWHSRLYHANIRSNFGLLRYILITPQSHRVHHSREPGHFNRNYGAMLSIWDYLFGTQYRNYDVYPQTGIPDESFPVETADSVWSVLTSPIRQMIYPFRYLWKVVFEKRSRRV